MMSNETVSAVRVISKCSSRSDNVAPNGKFYQGSASGWWARIERVWWVVWAGAMVVFSAFPIANHFLGLSTKDYGLWYQVGLAVRQGLDIYPRPDTGRLFPFMYPPSAAAMLAWLSFCGSFGSLFVMVIVNSLSWLICILLSVWLAVGPTWRRHPLVVIAPSLSTVVLIYNIYLLGQPNLVLLALLLGTFACLRLRCDFSAGALLATAAAIKAFPILVLSYLIYRRLWKATGATCVVLAAWLLIAPLPFRTPAQALDDLVVWSEGMVFTYNSYGIAQRPFRSYSYKNQSIMALAHRLLRDVPADGESVLSRKARVSNMGPRPAKGIVPIDPSTDSLSLLKPHVQASAGGGFQHTDMSLGKAKTVTSPSSTRLRPQNGSPRWDDVLHDAEPELRVAWKVNIVNLNFRTVTLVTGAAMLTLCLIATVVMPPHDRRTWQTDSIEFAIVCLLTLIFSPLSFNYAYVWLIYPITLGLHIVLSEPSGTPQHRLKIVWMVSVLAIPALAIPMPLVAQAYGNLFVPALVMVLGLGAILHELGRSVRTEASVTTPHAPQQEFRIGLNPQT